MKRSPRMIVVGGGVVGATTALLLQQAGARVQLVERTDPREQPPTAELGRDLRTVALAPGAIALLTRLGVWDPALEAASCGYEHMHVWDAEGGGVIDFQAAELGIPGLGSLVENRLLVEALWARLAAAGVTLSTGTEVQDLHWQDPVAVLQFADGSRAEAELVVAADGGRSRLRQLAAIDSEHTPMGQRALVTLALLSEHHRDTAWQRFLPSGPLAFLPLPPLADAAMQGARSRVSVVWSLDEDQASAVAELDDDAFAAALGEALEYRCGHVLAVDRRVQFPLHQLHARRYAAPGVVLAGDAAHVLHPLAGQGVNLGLRDALLLAREFERVGRGRVPLGDPDLWYHYERVRRGENALMLQAMTRLRTLFGSRRQQLRWLRGRGMRWVNRLGPLKRELMWPALGLEDADDRPNLSA